MLKGKETGWMHNDGGRGKEKMEERRQNVESGMERRSQRGRRDIWKIGRERKWEIQRQKDKENIENCNLYNDYTLTTTLIFLKSVQFEIFSKDLNFAWPTNEELLIACYENYLTFD